MFMATVSNMDWPRSRYESSMAQHSQLSHYVHMMASTHLNAVMFQVRPAADALYNSSIEPWSKYVRACTPHVSMQRRWPTVSVEPFIRRVVCLLSVCLSVVSRL